MMSSGYENTAGELSEFKYWIFCYLPLKIVKTVFKI